MTKLSQITTGLGKLGAVLRAQAWQQAETMGLTPTQAQILVLLVRRGPARVGEVAEQLAVSQPTASEAIAALVRKGQVEKRRDANDARASLLHPTAAGRQAAQAIETWPDAFLGVLDVLDETERGALLRALSKMIRQLQLRGEMPTQRVCVSCSHFRPGVHADPAAPHHCAFLGVPFGDAGLRMDCGDHSEAGAPQGQAIWERFIAAGP